MKKEFKILGTLVGFFLLWEILVILLKTPTYLLPKPSLIFNTLFNNFSMFIYHTLWTSSEIILGFLLAIVVAFIISILAVYSKYVKEVIHPLLVIIQVVPKIALAPLFLIWMGYGISPKILIAALVCFFPIIINFSKGLNLVNQNLIDIMRSMGSTKKEILFKVQIPFSLPYLFSGLRVGIALAAVGAIVGEFVAATKGLGYLISYHATLINTPLVFAAIFMTTLLGIFLYMIIVFIERKVVFWEKERVFN